MYSLLILVPQHNPFNLLGRDLTLTLGIGLRSTPEGMVVTTPSEYTFSLVQDVLKPQPLQIYQWWINLQQSVPLITMVTEHVSSEACFMKPEHLLCTAYVSTSPDTMFQCDFFTIINDIVHTRRLYWSATCSTLSVCLSPEQLTFYRVSGSNQHISLAKSPTD